MQRPVIYLYTDGAASGNPGPGGYGVVLKCAGLTREISGGFRLTTNNRMELLAVIIGLEAIKCAFGVRGDAFDPNLHNAVMMTQDDGLEAGQIAEVLLKGYSLGDRVVRHAMVRVAE